TDLWWPRRHRRSPEATMVLEPRVDGRLFERAPNGEEWSIGRITEFEPDTRLAFNWFPGSPGSPTDVRVDFRATAAGSDVVIVHRALSENAVAAWPTKVALFERGWDTVLPALAAFVSDHLTDKDTTP